MNINSYLIMSIIVFIIMVIILFNSKHPNDKNTSPLKKIIISFLIALVAPAIIYGALIMFNLGKVAHGG